MMSTLRASEDPPRLPVTLLESSIQKAALWSRQKRGQGVRLLSGVITNNYEVLFEMIKIATIFIMVYFSSSSCFEQVILS